MLIRARSYYDVDAGSSSNPQPMLWFFEREKESLRVETRYDNDTSEFVTVVRYPDGHEHTEPVFGDRGISFMADRLRTES